jgi:dienelactone hydrolase
MFGWVGAAQQSMLTWALRAKRFHSSPLVTTRLVSNAMNINAVGKQETINAREALLEAIARGRALPLGPPPTRAASLPTQPSVLALFNSLEVEELEYCADPSAQSPSQSWVPMRLVSNTNLVDMGGSKRRPCTILLHPTGQSKDYVAQLQARYAQKGYISVAIDARYHGAREDPELHYQDALVRAWKDGIERPFLLDTVWDLIRLLDYLETREDVDPHRIGVTGYSLGGMHSWFLAAADIRIAAAAPMAGVQSFAYAIASGKFQARVDSIPRIFHVAAADAEVTGITKEVVQSVWKRLLPGMLERYDASASLPVIAPRPLLVVTGEEDPRCPLPGVLVAAQRAREAYASAGAPAEMELFIQPGIGHVCTMQMLQKVEEFFDSVFMSM